MCDVKCVKAEDMFRIISEVIGLGRTAKITVTGSSMYPFLRDGIDSVCLSRCNFNDLRNRDIVLIKRDSGGYVMHRVHRKEKDCFYIVGDAQQWIEGPLRPDQLVAAVTGVWRRARFIECSGPGWRLLALIWMLMLPVRYRIIGIYQNIRAALSVNREIKIERTDKNS